MFLRLHAKHNVFLLAIEKFCNKEITDHKRRYFVRQMQGKCIVRKCKLSLGRLKIREENILSMKKRQRYWP